MISREQESSATGLFAVACEEMNDFARSLRELPQFGAVRTGADIRSYASGWRLEKWVEVQLDQSTGLWAAWWLEVGQHCEGWVVESHVAVGPEVLHLDFEARHAQSVVELANELSQAVDRLKRALHEYREFASEVTRSIATKVEQRS
jgi:hypothetical protein